MKKQIKVKPGTWIVIDSDWDETEAKQDWLKKHKFKKSIPDFQKKRESISVREGKTFQRRHFK